MEFTNNKFDTTYVTFIDIEFNYGQASRDLCHQVEVAVSTDYVWIYFCSIYKVYVIDVVQVIIIKTITAIKPSYLLSVKND